MRVGLVVTAGDAGGQLLAQVAADRSAPFCDIGDGELDRAAARGLMYAEGS